MSVSVEDLHSFIRQYEQYMEQQCPYLQCQASVNNEQLITICNDRINVRETHYHSIIQQTITMLKAIIKHQQQYNHRISTLEKQITTKQTLLKQQEHQIHEQRTKCEDVQTTCENLSNQIMEMRQKEKTQRLTYEQISNEFKQQEINTQQNVIQISHLKQCLHKAKENIQILESTYHQNVDNQFELEQTITATTNALQSKQNEIVKLQNQLKWQVQNNTKHFQILQEKNELILSLQQQLQDMHRSMHPIDHIEPNCQVVQRKESIVSSEDVNIQLCEEIQDHANYHILADYRSNYRNSFTPQNTQQFDNQKQPKSQLKHHNSTIPDLYYAHFLLTSQSVKIKLADEDALNVDVKPYYATIIKQRVPMHIWDQWISKELKKASQTMKKSHRKSQ